MNLEQALNDYLEFAEPGISTPATGKFFTEFCYVSPSRGCLVHHHGTCPSLGHPACEGSTCCLGLAFGQSPALRHLV